MPTDTPNPASQSFYWSGTPGGATSGLVLRPDYQAGSLQKATLEDVQNHIDQYSGGKYANDPWSQNYVQALRSGLSQIQSGASSGYIVNPATGNLDTLGNINASAAPTGPLQTGSPYTNPDPNDPYGNKFRIEDYPPDMQRKLRSLLPLDPNQTFSAEPKPGPGPWQIGAKSDMGQWQFTQQGWQPVQSPEQQRQSQLESMRSQLQDAQNQLNKIGSTDNFKPSTDVAGSSMAHTEINNNAPALNKTSDIAGANASASASTENNPTQEDFKTRLAELQKQQDDLKNMVSKGGLASIFGNKPAELNYDQLVSKVFQSMGLPADFTKQQFDKLTANDTKIASLQEKLDNLDKEEQLAKTNAEGQQIPMGLINRQTDQITRKYAIEKTSIAADMMALSAVNANLQKRFDEVDQLVDKAVAFATHQQDQERADYRWMYEQYQSQIKDLGTKYETLYKDMLDKRDAELRMTQEDLRWKATEYIRNGVQPPDMNTLKNMNVADVARAFKNKLIEVSPGATLYDSITGKAVYTAPKTYAPKTSDEDAIRVSVIQNLINNKKGSDRKIAWETYSEAAQKWIGMGGNVTDFKTAFPAESLMDKGNLNVLPESLQPSGYKPTPTVQDVQNQTKDVFNQYKTAGYTRQQIEDQWKSENNTTTISPLIKSTLDQLYPSSKPWWHFW